MKRLIASGSVVVVMLFGVYIGWQSYNKNPEKIIAESFLDVLTAEHVQYKGNMNLFDATFQGTFSGKSTLIKTEATLSDGKELSGEAILSGDDLYMKSNRLSLLSPTLDFYDRYAKQIDALSATVDAKWLKFDFNNLPSMDNRFVDVARCFSNILQLIRSNANSASELEHAYQNNRFLTHIEQVKKRVYRVKVNQASIEKFITALVKTELYGQASGCLGNEIDLLKQHAVFEITLNDENELTILKGFAPQTMRQIFMVTIEYHADQSITMPSQPVEYLELQGRVLHDTMSAR